MGLDKEKRKLIEKLSLPVEGRIGEILSINVDFSSPGFKVLIVGTDTGLSMAKQIPATDITVVESDPNVFTKALSEVSASGKNICLLNVVYPSPSIPANFDLIVFKHLLHLKDNETRNRILSTTQKNNPHGIICATAPGLGFDTSIKRFLENRQETFTQYKINHLTGGSVFLISPKISQKI